MIEQSNRQVQVGAGGVTSSELRDQEGRACRGAEIDGGWDGSATRTPLDDRAMQLKAPLSEPDVTNLGGWEDQPFMAIT